MPFADDELIHVTVAGDAGDPRFDTAPEGVVVHRVPDLHPDDVVVLPNGLPVTSVPRTLVDMAEIVPEDELRAMFGRAREMGLLDVEAIRACVARVEWRPSLRMLDEVIADFA